MNNSTAGGRLRPQKSSSRRVPGVQRRRVSPPAAPGRDNDQAVCIKPAVCQIIGYKNSGKTSLVCALIPLLKQGGTRVAVIKHDGHEYDMDHPGTDTWKQRQAGAMAVAITSTARTSVIEERGSSLFELIKGFSGYDYVLVEGFKQEAYPKIVLIRRPEDLELLQNTANIAAIAAWERMIPYIHSAVPQPQAQVFEINDSAGMANLLHQQRSNFQNFNI
ncbi:molybdopterin-guanine dinucleotide biosynthesis protein B [Paenibacillus sp. PastM-3]|uniref:molybdopterin-guanine dinucleotide biosynthesis protein B n=1 Tax=Paenibacillus sp. PastM-3 TaxID=2940534 RepID=UPI002474CE8C|nr:molybdopterin-guanine dinucleotide biosynthesis protein B [Paenibacillus sp. PastM-3]